MRKLASVQKIKSVRPIPDADNIVCVSILGWECVSQKGNFKEGDFCVYFEPDSLLPVEERFEFLRKGCYKESLGRFKLKTVKLRGQISQGLALPLSLFPELVDPKEGDDVTEILNIEKYEPPVPAEISGDARGFSWPISKTDETRIQNDEEYGFLAKMNRRPYVITLKLDGTSSTFLIDPKTEEYHVCGRNYSYLKKPTHYFWKISERYDLEAKLRKLWAEGTRVAIQGEVVGLGIQKNKLGLEEVDLYVFNVVDIDTNTKLSFNKAQKIIEELGLKSVPVLEKHSTFRYSREELLEKARGKYKDHFPSASHNQDREGIVIRSLDSKISFKAINNDFLLKEDKDDDKIPKKEVAELSLNEKVEQMKKDWKGLDQGPRVVPLTVDDSKVKPLTVDNSNVKPLTVEEPKPKTFWGDKPVCPDQKWH